ncbi:MAG: diguanylate cyclase [Gammaproteobacteria bacterium]|nr:diguanylate cyclase [Gammaproteobacteria bacterium]
MLPTYRLRLIAYTILLVSFLTATMAYTYIYSRDVILEEAENSVTNTSLLLNGNVELEEKALQRYIELVRTDLRIKEYMFMLVKVGTDNEALKSLYDQHYGWLPVKRHIILSANGRILLGKEHKDLAQTLKKHMKISNQGIFYAHSGNAVEMVTWAPVSYQATQLGIIALTHAIDHEWMERHQQYSGGYLFLENNGSILLSNLPSAEGELFLLKDGHLDINDELYQIRPIILSSSNNSPYHLWYAVSMRSLLAKLERHSRIVLLLTLSGACAILWLGLIIVRNFNKPLSELMHITRSVAKGHLPVMTQTRNKNEIYMLSNQFAVMLQALREKQEEIDRVHQELEQSAITDSLTRLYNRRYLQEIFPRLMSQAQRDHLFLAGILLDLDHFKQINDRHGHLAGDHCLIHLAQLLRETSRPNDYVFRIGGEEFFVLSINDNPQASQVLGEKIRSSLEKHPAAFKNTIIPITTSIGISHTDTTLKAEDALTHLLYHADKALYRAKEKGRNQIQIYHHTDSKSDSIFDNAS